MSTPDYFARFGLPCRYALDVPALDAAYERLSLEHHPDFFSTAPAEQQQEAQRVSAELNAGYRTLRSDAARAAYLLDLLRARHLPPGATLDGDQLPAGFLQEMFLLQEELDELAEDAQPQRQAALKAQIAAKQRQVLEQRAALFAAADRLSGQEPAATAQVLQEIQSNLNQEKYLQRLLQRLD